MSLSFFQRPPPVDPYRIFHIHFSCRTYKKITSWVAGSSMVGPSALTVLPHHEIVFWKEVKALGTAVDKTGLLVTVFFEPIMFLRWVTIPELFTDGMLSKDYHVVLVRSIPFLSGMSRVFSQKNLRRHVFVILGFSNRRH